MDIQNIIETLEREYDLKFQYSHLFEDYRAKYKDITFDISISTYNTDDERHGKEFISVGWSQKSSGGGSPCDSIEEVMERFDRFIERKMQISFF